MAPSSPRHRLFLLIPTHTTRHLACCLASIVRQDRPPDGIVVTCDVDDPRIGALLDEFWPMCARAIAQRAGAEETVPAFLHTFRAHAGHERLNQVRNNGLRALDSVFSLNDEDALVVLDGDTMLDETALRAHDALLSSGRDLVIAFRAYLDEQTTAGITPQRLLDERPAEAPLSRLLTPEHRKALRDRQRRALRNLWLRRASAGLFVKGHKPKIVGGHHGVRIGCLRAVNGYDERFSHYGLDDDDLARRLYALRPRIRAEVAVERIPAYHLWHPTRAPASPTESTNYGKFRERGPVATQAGWSSPLNQPTPIIRTVSAAASRARAAV